ncbi:DgyrCDS2741 [Dimorphilus gyrociliatus]|uniref:Metalloendopeptidase n=1 Tax=Dimorphilus gyrociliatus TaxID=2664684 RepID=A0A7I8VE85_9ANNE|nr:DgyrCDS2741 [Dimorphilus gyrociliatus]
MAEKLELELQYQPKDCSRDVWLQHCGSCDVDKWKDLGQKCRQVRQLLGDEKDMDSTFSCRSACKIGDMVLSNEQIIQILKDNEEEKNERKRRKKRKIRSFKSFPSQKWSLPILYKIDNSFGKWEKGIIKSAIDMWQNRTCLEFKELKLSHFTYDSHVMFLKITDQACFSYVGKVAIVPQPIYLSSSCFNAIAVVAHEIGHTLGLLHEHQRPDRDDYIIVNKDNIDDSHHSDFSKIQSKFAEDLGVPYDYASDMHYRSFSFSVNGKTTIDTKDSRYQRTIGQRSELAFSDIKVINLAYCQEKCKVKAPNCQHSGYQNPLNCNDCHCPDGLGGELCNFVAPPVLEQCGGRLIAMSKERVITSPGYSDRGYYLNGQQCSWRIRSIDPTKRVTVQFTGDFGLYCFVNCYHWVEVKFKKNLGLTGPRYCCDETPKETFKSEGDELVVSMKAINHVIENRHRRGFKMIIRMDGDECQPNPCKNGATCKDLQSNYTCQCLDGFSGKDCEIEAEVKDPCKSNPCLKNGTCIVIDKDNYQCKCAPYYIGTRCERYYKPTRNPRYCSALVDVALVLDSSNEVGLNNWNNVKQFAKSIVENIDVAPDRNRVSLISYSEIPKIEHKFSDSQEIHSIYSSIDRSAFLGDDCNLYRTLKSLRTSIFAKDNTRINAVGIIVLLISSECSKDLSVIRQETWTLQQMGVEILPVTIGKKYSHNLISSLSNKKEFFKVDYFAQLLTISKNLQAILCPQEKVSDIAIMVETNRHVSKSKYNVLQFFLMEFVKKFEIGLTQNLISIGKYSAHTYVAAYLRQNLQPSQLSTIITTLNLDYQSDDTNLLEVMDTLTDLVYTPIEGGRSFSNKIAIVINSGPLNDPTVINQLMEKGKKLRENMTFLMAGIGDKINKDLLINLAGGRENTFFMRTFSELHQFLENVLTRINKILKARKTLPTTEPSSGRSTTPLFNRHSFSSSLKPATTTYAPIKGWYQGETCYPSKTDGECSRKCGGCGRKIIIYKCYIDGIYRREHREQFPCNVNACTKEEKCLIYAAGLFWIPCDECCLGYKRKGDICIPLQKS